MITTQPAPQIVIYTTGGTIDKQYSKESTLLEVGETIIPDLLSQANLAFHYEVKVLLQKDSMEITDDDRKIICNTIQADVCPYIVITHGTDTMIRTARALVGTGAATGKTIVLTGAMIPASIQKSDALFNIGFALSAVQTLPKGVHIAMNGRIHDPFQAQKNRKTHQFEENL